MENGEIGFRTKVIAAVDELISDERIKQAFDLSDQEMDSLRKVRVTDVGFDVSPNFQSLGWGENDSGFLTIDLSD